MNNYRTCIKCLKCLPLSDFYVLGNGYRKDCKLCYKLQVKEWQTKNREQFLLKVREYKQNNKPYYAAQSSKRRSVRKGATPALTPQERKDIRDIYDLADQMRSLGLDVAVDHIDPLQSDSICGLHNPYNLRILPTRENLQKSNKFVPYGVDALGHIHSLADGNVSQDGN